jgi:hypothetical protein
LVGRGKKGVTKTTTARWSVPREIAVFAVGLVRTTPPKREAEILSRK